MILRNFCTKHKKCTIEPKRYTAMLLYLFLILYWLLAQKKRKVKNDPRLPTLPYCICLWVIVLKISLHFSFLIRRSNFRCLLDV